MNHYIEDYLARQLQVKRRQIGSWELKVVTTAHVFTGVAVPGNLEARLQMRLHGVTPVQWERLQRRSGSLVLGTMLEVRTPRWVDEASVVDLDLLCVYGKETQHLFKALLQAFTVRGPQKKRKNK